MRYFLHKWGDVVDYYDDVTWRRHFRGSNGHSLILENHPIPAWPEEYYQVNACTWGEISRKEAELLIVKWRMGA